MNTLPEEILDTIYKYKYQMEFQEVVEDLNCIDIREVEKDFNRKGRFEYCCCVWNISNTSHFKFRLDHLHVFTAI